MLLFFSGQKPLNTLSMLQNVGPSINILHLSVKYIVDEGGGVSLLEMGWDCCPEELTGHRGHSKCLPVSRKS